MIPPLFRDALKNTTDEDRRIAGPSRQVKSTRRLFRRSGVCANKYVILRVGETEGVIFTLIINIVYT
jgi:hypothetical protein